MRHCTLVDELHAAVVHRSVEVIAAVALRSLVLKLKPETVTDSPPEKAAFAVM
jgi:hypothetical protein